MNKVKGVFTWLKHKLVGLVITNRGIFTFQRIIVILAMINALLQIALGRIHNQAAYNVSSTVSIYTFIMQICLLLAAVSFMRMNEKKKYILYSTILVIISTIVIIVYIVLMRTDVYYLTAINGGYSYEDAIRIVYSIDDSITLQVVAIIFNAIEMILFVIELINRRRIKNGLSSEGRA